MDHSREFFWHRVRWEVVSSFFPRARTTRVVDVGAGIGLLGEFLARDFPDSRYRFIEPIEYLERELEHLFGVDANVREATKFEGDDFVTLLDVLEHQEDDRAFLEGLAGKMEPGATLIVTVPALKSLWSSWDDALGHYRRYDRPALERAVTGLPFEVKEASFLFPEMLLPALLRRRRPAAAGAEFPDLPKPVNEAFYRLSRLTAARRRSWSHGTSMLAVLERR